MNTVRFTIDSARSEKARIGVRLNKVFLIILSVCAVVLVLSGVIFVVVGLPVGWVLIGLSVLPAMVVEWYRGELHHLPIEKGLRSIDASLSGSILGRITTNNPTPREIASIVTSVPGGQFFTVRFGISASFLQELSSISPDDMEKVWHEAVEVRNQTKSRNISAAIMVVALLKASEQSQNLLNHLQLNFDDLIKGVEWYDHLRDLVEQHRMPHQTGGVARDWSFGWTPLLNRFGQNISQQVGFSGALFVRLATHIDALEQLVDIFSKKGRQNAILVGSAGVGKTEIVNAFALKLLDASEKLANNLKFRQVFMLDSAAIIAASPGRGDLEQLLIRVLNEAYSAKNIIICLDRAELFFEDGVGSIDISNILLPILEAGNLRIILTMDEQKYLQIGQRNPAVINSLNRISVKPTNQMETISVMQDKSILIEFQHKVTFMYQAFVEAYCLSERYIHDLAMPGRAIKLLELAADFSDGGLVTVKSLQRAIEKMLDIKVGVANDDSEREKLLNLEQLIHERMINQNRAVNVVSDALRRARAGIRNQNRPIGTFLFLGPTGVGKTELAKALAGVYFGGEDRIVRSDMNEYSGVDDVSRLIADAADNPNSLTARMIKQPFSVVLLDEIEKAHPNVLAALLQMLDEGILCDTKNREVSFRDAIVIATSNAGADRIREYIERGYNLEQFENKFTNELIDSHQFRPEFLNRFDEIVLFRPLNKSELLQVVDIMIGSVNRTLAVQKISIEVALDAKEYLVEAGYDPRLGARPMRRVVQRAVESTVARQMLGGVVQPGSVIKISLDQVKQLLDASNVAQQIIEQNSTLRQG